MDKTSEKKGPGRGGKREGAGNKSPDGVTRSNAVLISALVTPEQREKFLMLGGSAWLRAIIDQEFDKGI